MSQWNRWKSWCGNTIRRRKNSAGCYAKNKKVNLSLPDAAENLTENEVKDAMNEMCEANLFVKEEVDQYQAPLSAQYVERTVTSVFDDSEKN